MYVSLLHQSLRLLALWNQLIVFFPPLLLLECFHGEASVWHIQSGLTKVAISTLQLDLNDPSVFILFAQVFLSNWLRLFGLTWGEVTVSCFCWLRFISVIVGDYDTNSVHFAHSFISLDKSIPPSVPFFLAHVRCLSAFEKKKKKNVRFFIWV